MLSPRTYQLEAKNAVIAHFRREKSNCLIKASVGAGKSLIAALLANEAISYNETDRVLICAHREELITQNAADKYFPSPELVSIYSASVGERNASGRIVVGQIQSIYDKAAELGDFKLIIVDEAHRCTWRDDDDSMYGQLFKSYPHVLKLGMSGTPYRMKDGDLPLPVVYKIEPWQLIKMGFLVPLINKAPDIDIDLTQVRRGVKGDYIESELSEEMLKKVEISIEQILKYSIDRKSWLGFCVDEKHCYAIWERLREHVSCAYITSNTSKNERRTLVKMFKEGNLTCLLTVNIATEGFDAPNIDFLFCLRPTESKGLWEQMLGRGLRCLGADINESIANGKKDCLLADLSGNLIKHGGIGFPNQKILPKLPKGGEIYTHKICVNCDSEMPINQIVCPACGHETPKLERVLKHRNNVDTKSSPVFTPEDLLPKIKNVRHVEFIYWKTKNEGKNDTLKIKYLLDDNDYVAEWVCAYHPNNSPAKNMFCNMMQSTFGTTETDPNKLQRLYDTGKINSIEKVVVRRRADNPKFYEVMARYAKENKSEKGQEGSRVGGSAGSSGLDEAVLLDDEIPF